MIDCFDSQASGVVERVHHGAVTLAGLALCLRGGSAIDQQRTACPPSWANVFQFGTRAAGWVRNVQWPEIWAV